MNEHIVLEAAGYDRIDGRNAYRSPIKRLTLGAPTRPENREMRIAAQIWRENEDGTQAIDAELPIHQVIDLMLFLSRSMLHFREAYRLPKRYDPAQPILERIGVQGDALQVAVCTENPDLDRDILDFERALGELGELTGERLRTLSRVLEELQSF